MIDIRKSEVQAHLFEGNFGLEKEMLRVTEDGFFSRTLHPFKGRDSIVRDFCENQLEINTKVHSSIEGAMGELESLTKKIQTKLSSMEERELLWPFSNPPYIRRDQDIPVAQFEGDEYHKTEYRNYLSERYGRYKMSLSGIHVNFSFSDELLNVLFKESSSSDFRLFKDSLYLELARKLTLYGWLITVLTAASSITDSSYNEKGVIGKSSFTGMASVRCSEVGYWNLFAPVFDYSDVKSYVQSIRSYVNDGYIAYPSELYYPIRIKPKGANNLERLVEYGVSHIEMRMVDNNPLIPIGLDIRDVKFIHLFVIWLMSLPDIELSKLQQVASVQNFKNAAHYDLKTVTISIPGFETNTIADVGICIIERMEKFYSSLKRSIPLEEVLEFQKEKLVNPECRYSWQVKNLYASDYVSRGIELSKEYQDGYLN